MSAIESAFVNSVISRDRDKDEASESSFGTISTSMTCAQQDTMARRILGSRMWKSKSAARDKSE